MLPPGTKSIREVEKTPYFPEVNHVFYHPLSSIEPIAHSEITAVYNRYDLPLYQHVSTTISMVA